ncbi:hypothetical protein BT69DRAFT_1350839 [Atractiella rhizophila]|nr:hypothetical protein BT69DRAFT_1350839 [Atractiella rhizophila]
MDEPPNQPIFDSNKSFENFLRQRKTVVTDAEQELVDKYLNTASQQAADDGSSSQKTDTSNGAALGDGEIIQIRERDGTLEPSERVAQGVQKQETQWPAVTPVDERQCKICLARENAELGQLISPCRCRGSIGLVHVTCLDAWRHASPTSQSFFECPQCHYRYRFTRRRIAGLAESKPTLLFLTVLLYLLLIFFSGHIAAYLLSFSSIADPYSNILERGDPLESSIHTALRGLSASLNMDFSFVLGEDKDEEVEADNALMAIISDIDTDSLEYGVLPLIPDEHGDALGRAVWNLQQVRRKKRARMEGRPVEGSSASPWGMKTAFHFLLGLVFLSLATSMLVPLTLCYFGPFQRMAWVQRLEGVNLDMILLTALVVYRSVRDFMTCWRWTKIGVVWGLKKIEMGVLEVER